MQPLTTIQCIFTVNENQTDQRKNLESLKNRLSKYTITLLKNNEVEVFLQLTRKKRSDSEYQHSFVDSPFFVCFQCEQFVFLSFIIESYHRFCLTRLLMNRFQAISCQLWLHLSPCRSFGMHQIRIRCLQRSLIAHSMLLHYSLEIYSLDWYKLDVKRATIPV